MRRFDARPWLGEISTRAASVVTARDPVVPPARQLELARTLGAFVLYVDGDHHAAVRQPRRFLPSLVEACHRVTRPAPASATAY